MYRAVCHEYLSFIDLYNCNSAFFNDLRLDCSQACEVCCIRKCLQNIENEEPQKSFQYLLN